ncbi:MAG: chromosomal replication initiator protein DnaA [Acidimicrobiaceae bacterium]|nr:chromosomal replication initiator protein DnaA [Acidimicrobiaceae bacterium]
MPQDSNSLTKTGSHLWSQATIAAPSNSNGSNNKSAVKSHFGEAITINPTGSNAKNNTSRRQVGEMPTSKPNLTPVNSNGQNSGSQNTGFNITSRVQAKQLWSECAQNIRNQVSGAVWETTFNNIKAVALQRNLLVMEAPTSLHKMRIERNYFPLLKNAVEKTRPGIDICIEINKNLFSDCAADDQNKISQTPVLDDDTTQNTMKQERLDSFSVLTSAPNEEATKNKEPIIKSSEVGGNRDDSGLTSHLTFDQFVTGSSNRFAHAAALAVAEQPSCEYNPLFIYGDSGMGKTHLLQAIANYSIENHPDQKFRYVTSETFLNEFVRAIRNNLQPDFKQRYRHNKLLLVDDIQFLQDKDSLQEEFFHTFNDVMQNGGRIVLSSDRPPNAIPTLENRLRSRFRSGLITDIQPPDLVTRMAILQKKLESKFVTVTDDVIAFIAENIKNSIRELEGALIKVIAYTNLSGETCDLMLAQELLNDIIDNSNKAPVTIDLIIAATAETLGFTSEQLTGVSRRRSLVEARQIAMYIARNSTDLSYPEVGKAFGNRDHSTVMHAFKKIQNQLSENRDLFNRVQQVQQRVNTR